MTSARGYPTPLIVPPAGDQHTHTFILLHGRGSNSERFGKVFLESTGIANRLRTVKFIFPTAKKRRSTVLKRTVIHQWFDNYSLTDPNARAELQLEGLEESCAFLRKLVHDEARLLRETGDDPAVGDGYGRVVIGGLSQGCAASMFGLLGGFAPDNNNQGRIPRLGGFVGMSGWLPFERDIAGLLQGVQDGDGDEEEEEENPFATDADEDDMPSAIQALNHVRDILALPPLEYSQDSHVEAGSVSTSAAVDYLKTPVFLGHGAEDPKVSVALGERMGEVLSDGFGMDVTWRSYEGFGHWYKVPDEIDDVLRFLQDKVRVPVEESAV